MTRIFTEGFEMGDGLFWSSAAGAIATTSPRSGTYHWNNNANTACYQTFTGLSELYFRTGFLVNAFTNQAFIGIRNSSTAIFTIAWNGTGYTAVVNGTSQVLGTYSANIWFLLEVYLKIADSPNGRCIVKLDGVTVWDFTGDTLNASNTTVDNFYCIRPSATLGGGVVYLDDIALNDTNNGDGKGDNSWCGDGHIIALTPNGNGTTNQWTGSDGNSTDNYLLVDERPANNDTDYVEDSTTGNRDMYAMSDFDASGNKTILRVWPECRARDTVAAGGQIKLGVRTNSTVYLSAAKSLLTTYTSQIKGDDYKTNPNSASAWTDSEADAVEFVVETV